MEIDEKVRQVWFDDFNSKMKKEKNDDVIIAYNQLAMAFPSGPHSKYPDTFALDTHAVQKWSSENGWDADFDPESTDKDHPKAPSIRFTKKRTI